ncbi:MAG TPA: glycosyltransferase family 2 protein [Planctomycetes bacterium]|nr:glycosyltransferase family 2 protein [Planctomycetota bacterium]HIJ71403.1 glycosyltransferase family 2 protein [Planctomycetota bacterium]
MSMTIGVVIPAYNSASHIRRAIDSVLAQTRLPDEIIVADDGSTDNTADIVEGYGAAVKLIRRPNAGASVARNTAINAVSSNWIAFLDSDDEWLPEKLLVQSELLRRNSELVWATANFIYCHCGRNKHNQKLEEEKGRMLLNGKDFFQDYFAAYIKAAAGWTGTMIVKRSVLIEAGLFRPEQLRFNDEDMWWRIAYRYPVIGYTPEPLAIYHMYVNDSITKKYQVPKNLDELIENHIKIATDCGKYEHFRPCAEHILRYWIHQYWFDERIRHINQMTKRFDQVLPPLYKLALRLLTIWPGATSVCMPVLSRINKVLRLRL